MSHPGRQHQDHTPDSGRGGGAWFLRCRHTLICLRVRAHLQVGFFDFVVLPAFQVRLVFLGAVHIQTIGVIDPFLVTGLPRQTCNHTQSEEEVVHGQPCFLFQICRVSKHPPSWTLARVVWPKPPTGSNASATNGGEPSQTCSQTGKETWPQTPKLSRLPPPCEWIEHARNGSPKMAVRKTRLTPEIP